VEDTGLSRTGGRELFVVGAGFSAVELAGWAGESGWKVAGLVELLDPARIGTSVGGYEVVDAATLPEGAYAVSADGRYHDRREAWTLAERRRCRGATLVHPGAHVAASATIAPGAIVGPLAVIGAWAEIGEHVLVSRGVLIGHNVTIQPFARVRPGANLAGHVEVGADATIAMGAVVTDHVSIGERALVAAGAVVVRDVPATTRVQGVPARPFEA